MNFIALVSAVTAAVDTFRTVPALVVTVAAERPVAFVAIIVACVAFSVAAVCRIRTAL